MMYPQTFEQLYDLRFQSTMENETDKGSWVYRHVNAIITIDSMQVVDDAFPCIIVSDAWKRAMPIPNMKGKSIILVLGKTIILPQQNKSDSCILILKTKCEVDSVLFSVTGINAKGDPVSHDSIYILKENDWALHKLKIEYEDIKAVSVSIRYQGELEKDKNKKIALSSLTVYQNGIKMNDCPVSIFSSGKLTQKAIIPVSITDLNSFSKIKDWKDKPLIGLGESTHGSKDIKELYYQILRYLITYEKGRMIVFEQPADMCLRWDLYVQGVLDENFETELSDELQGSFTDCCQLVDFLKWVRAYNTNHQQKVHVFGMDDKLRDGAIYLPDYFLKISKTRSDSLFYLQSMKNKTFEPLKNKILNDPYWKTITDSISHQYLVYLIEGCSVSDYPQSGAGIENVIQREYRMYQKVNKIMDLCSNVTCKVILYAHSYHVSKSINVNYSVPIHNMGSYLEEKYKNRYYTLSCQVGEGYFSQDSLATSGMYGNNTVTPLPIPPEYSFEKQALNTKIDCFFYPTDSLPKGIVSFALFFRGGYSKDAYSYYYIPHHFDAFIFIRESHRLQGVNKEPFFEMCRIIDQKQEQINKVLYRLKKETDGL